MSIAETCGCGISRGLHHELSVKLVDGFFRGLCAAFNDTFYDERGCEFHAEFNGALRTALENQS